jgi:AcrR family transcriptional regulator
MEPMAGSSRDGVRPIEESVRNSLIVAATTLLAEFGPSAIKVRRIAEASGSSTMAVYHYFGGVPELLRAVVDHGFDLLGTALTDAVGASTDAGVQLFVMALSTRQFAQENPHLYDMMFGLSTRGTYRYVSAVTTVDEPSSFSAAYAVLVRACAELVASGRVVTGDADQVAAELWSAVHGFVSLEMASHFAHFADPVRMVLAPMAVNHFVGMGDERSRAEQSAADALDWWNAKMN